MPESYDKAISWGQSSEKQARLLEAKLNGGGYFETCKDNLRFPDSR
jgi:hypothetical protein